jgi:hypothetical protein
VISSRNKFHLLYPLALYSRTHQATILQASELHGGRRCMRGAGELPPVAARARPARPAHPAWAARASPLGGRRGLPRLVRRVRPAWAARRAFSRAGELAAPASHRGACGQGASCSGPERAPRALLANSLGARVRAPVARPASASSSGPAARQWRTAIGASKYAEAGARDISDERADGEPVLGTTANRGETATAVQASGGGWQT